MNNKVVFIIIIIFSIFIINNRSNNYIEIDNNSLKLTIKATEQFKLINQETKELYNIIDHIKLYKSLNPFRKANLEIVVREIDNKDEFIFFKIECLKYCHSLSFNLLFDIGENYTVKDLTPYEIVKDYSAVTGYDETTLPSYYIESTNNSLILSKLYYSNNLVKKYNKGVSTLKELTAEQTISIRDKSGVINIPLNISKGAIEGWFLLSKDKLFSTDNDIENYAHFLNTNQTVSPWLTANGQYVKIPYSIEPYTKEGYGLNPGANHGSSELDEYTRTNNRLYYDLLLNKIKGLYNITRHNDGVWHTVYTSTYVYTPYGINAPYIDTRHNEGIANFLYAAGLKLNNKELLEDSLNYADYVVNEVKSGNTILITNDLYLMPDYFKDGNSVKTHASINHQLGTANYLLRAYQRINNKDYYDVGMSILKALSYQGNKWIKPDGDLWYRMNPDYSFEGIDYKVLTLEDLLIVQETLEVIGEPKIEMFDNFIITKYNYLTSINYEIPKEIINKFKEWQL